LEPHIFDPAHSNSILENQFQELVCLTRSESIQFIAIDQFRTNETVFAIGSHLVYYTTGKFTGFSQIPFFPDFYEEEGLIIFDVYGGRFSDFIDAEHLNGKRRGISSLWGCRIVVYRWNFIVEMEID
jgi:hypothetical protein